jgi:hypothetical protein
MKLAAMIGFALLLLVLGSYCLLFPERVELRGVRVAQPGVKAKSSLVVRYVPLKTYKLYARMVGIIAYLMAAGVAFAIYRGGAR